MTSAKNAMQIKSPELLTVKTLRKYLDDMEAVWTDEDTSYMGEFEDHKINCLYQGLYKGIGPAKIVYDGGLDFIILEQSD